MAGRINLHRITAPRLLPGSRVGAGPAYDITVDARQVHALIAKVSAELDAPKLGAAVGAAQLRWIDHQFRSGGSAKPLRDTGRLAQSFDWRVHGNDAVEVGTAPYRMKA